MLSLAYGPSRCTLLAARSFTSFVYSGRQLALPILCLLSAALSARLRPMQLLLCLFQYELELRQRYVTLKAVVWIFPRNGNEYYRRLPLIAWVSCLDSTISFETCPLPLGKYHTQ